MPRRSSTREDINEIAARVVAISTGQATPKFHDKKKNPAAVALGKLGGSKGGKIRAKRLSASRRKEIAQQAARARWSTK
jgi:hypothetical protein